MTSRVMMQGGNREKWKEQDAVWSCSHKCFVFAVGGRSEQGCTATVYVSILF